MKIANKKILLVILPCAVTAMVCAVLFLARESGRDGGKDSSTGSLFQKFAALFSDDSAAKGSYDPDTIEVGGRPPSPVDGMDMVYLYTDSQGASHISDDPPVGYDYQVVYIPKRTSGEKREQLKLDIAEKAKKIMRGEKVHDTTVKKPMNTGREFHQLPRTTAGDILSKSNELRQNVEKQNNHSR